MITEKEIQEIEETVFPWNVVSTATGEVRCTVTCSLRMSLFQLRGNSGEEVLRVDHQSKYGGGNYWYPVFDGEPSKLPVERDYPDHLDPVKRREKRKANLEKKRVKANRINSIVKVLEHLQGQGIDLGPDAADLLN